MKKRDFLNLLSDVNPEYIEEADPDKAPKIAKKRVSFNLTTFLACAACFLLILNLSVFLPFLRNNDSNIITPGSDSGITVNSGNTNDSLNHLQPPTTESKPPVNNDNPTTESTPSDTPPSVDDNTKNELFGALDGYFEDEKDVVNDELQDALDKSEQENEATSPDADINDNQVEGVSEGDIIKRSDKHIFYLSNMELSIYSIDKDESRLLSRLPLNSYIANSEEYKEADKILSQVGNDMFEELDDSTHGWEMYLSQDYKTLTVITPEIGKGYYVSGGITTVLTLDVSNSPAITLTSINTFAGEYVSSRIVNDELILFTRYRIFRNYTKETNESFIPFYVSGNGSQLSCDIYFPSELYSSTYLVMGRLDVESGKVKETSSFLGYSDTMYVSKDNIYITREIKNDRTEILRIEYSLGDFTLKGTVTVSGTLNNQYSLDEYNGYLRVVTTVNTLLLSKNPVDKQEDTLTESVNASLYCIDINTMKTVASVECFAPEGDVVRSVRFDKNTVTVCTSLYYRPVVDPVFVFDLTDINNITYTDTGIIDGYSEYMINFKGGFSVGIGYGENKSTLKIEAYYSDGEKVISVCVYESPNTTFSTNYKSYYINRELGLIGLATYNTQTKAHRYLLLQFTGNEFGVVSNQFLSYSFINSVRGFYDDGYYYTVTDKDFYTIHIGKFY